MAARRPNPKRVQELREARGWPQQQLADVAELSTRTVQRVEAGQGASMETLQALASAFDTEVDDLLETPERPEPTPKVTVLNRLRSGEEVCHVVGGAHMYQQEYDTPEDEQQVELLGSFLQDAHDIGEIWDDAEPMHRVQWAHGIGKSIKELEEAGYRAFGARVPRRFRMGEGGEPFTMSVATLMIVRATNSRILRRGTEQEHLAVVLGPFTI